MDKQPLVSVLLVTWNRRQELQESLNSVVRQTYPNIEIVVVDNASTDGTAAMVREKFPQALLVRSHKNLGCPSGRNLGFANCRGKYVYLLDDDGWLAPDALEISVRRAQSDDRLGVIISALKEVDGNRVIRTFPTGVSQPVYVASFTGCCSMIQRELFEQVGGFPDDFFRQAEEEDLAIRLLDVGKYCFYEPASVMYHQRSPINRDMITFHYYTLRNGMKSGLRYWPFPYNILRTLRLMTRAMRYAVTRGNILWPPKLFGNLVSELLATPSRRRPVRLATYHLFRRLQQSPSATIPEDSASRTASAGGK